MLEKKVLSHHLLPFRFKDTYKNKYADFWETE